MKRYVVIAAGSAAALVAAFATGRFTAHPKTVVTTQTVEKVRTVTVERAVKDLAVDRHRVIERKPDGSSTTTTDTHLAERDRTKSATASEGDRTATTRTETTRPLDWMVGAVAMGNPAAFRLSDPGAALSAGVTVQRRIVGPFWVGGFAAVPVSHPVSVPAVGLSLSVGF